MVLSMPVDNRYLCWHVKSSINTDIFNFSHGIYSIFLYFVPNIYPELNLKLK